MNHTIAAQRLANQRITRPGPRDPGRLVSWFGAVQAQEFGPAKWGLGLRMPGGVTEAQVQRAFDAGRILRTHVLRPTWHFVSPADIRWMLELSAASVRHRMATYDRRLGLDTPSMNRATAIMERALGDAGHLTRVELGEHLARAGLPGKSTRLGHTALYAELAGVICSGPRRGKQFTYALVSERAPRAKSLQRDEALGEIATRFLQSHGPATHRDLSWWAGLTASDAKRAIEIAGARRLVAEGRTYWTVGRTPTARPPRGVHLLPIYDEYLVAYRDREAVPHGPALDPSFKGGYGTFQHAIVVDGQVAGTWKTSADDRGSVRVIPGRRFTAVETAAVRKVAERYGRFVAQASAR